MTHRLLPAVAGVAAIALLPAGAAIATTTTSAPAADHAATTAHAAGQGAHSAVTWNGWRGVRFGDTVRSAHHALGGRFFATPGGKGSCGDILQTSTGVIDAKVGPKHRVSDITVKNSVRYPDGTSARMDASLVTHRLQAHGVTVHTVTVDETGNGDYTDNNFAVGPHGHVLYYAAAHDGTTIYRMGLAVNRHLANQLISINGC